MESEPDQQKRQATGLLAGQLLQLMYGTMSVRLD